MTTMICKTLHRKLKIAQQELHKTTGNSADYDHRLLQTTINIDSILTTSVTVSRLKVGNKRPGGFPPLSIRSSGHSRKGVESEDTHRQHDIDTRVFVFVRK